MTAPEGGWRQGERAADGEAERGAPPELQALRSAIADLDRRLVELLAERVRLARRVGGAKRAAGLPTLDPAREAAVVRRASALAREHGLEPEAVRGIFWHLIGLSRRAQTEGP
ncbi:MAG TPA: chorismate mutase [Longimicrobiales bacterium]|nr:chorismate mutase [Longimicrobiales bacterium]